MSNDVCVVGAGLFGQVIAKELMRRGRDVTIVDDQRPLSGTAPSGMLTKPGWFAGMGKDIYNPALDLLRRNFTVHELEFTIRPSGKKTGIMLVEPADFNLNPDIRTVTKVEDQGRVHYADGISQRYDLVVVAAGIWSDKLVDVPKLEGKQGISFNWHVKPDFELDGFINLWAPYKHLVGFKMSPTLVWVGDGTALKPDNWTADREKQCLDRCHKHVKSKLKKGDADPIVGIRPYVKGYKAGYVKQLSPNLWVATGGAKNGTISAGHVAHVIAEATCGT
jgi:glycine/D-amino acid oxidase-like deaminating enzyme